MLLFLGIPRKDTKPLAKGLINEFGSLAGDDRGGPGGADRRRPESGHGDRRRSTWWWRQPTYPGQAPRLIQPQDDRRSDQRSSATWMLA